MHDNNDPVPTRVLRIRLPPLDSSAASALLEILDQLQVGFFEAYDREISEQARFELERDAYEESRSTSDDPDTEIPF